MSHALFDALRAFTDTANDTALSRHMKLDKRTLYRYRYSKMTIGPFLILQVYDMTGWTIEHIRELAASQAPRVTTMGRRQPMPKSSSPIRKPLKKCAPVEAKISRLTVTKMPQWTSTVHRAL